MFTGIVTHAGHLERIERRGVDARFVIAAPFDDLALGESIAIDGVCLTVAEILRGTFRVDASHETLARTTLGLRAPGDSVHLERALRLSDRLGGHLVSGHVDAVGELVALRKVGDAVELGVRIPTELGVYTATKGSIAIDGVSLTINEVTADTVTLTIIPHTQDVTRLGKLNVGAKVNVEVDVVARYVVRALSRERNDAPPTGVTLDALRRGGYL